MTRLSAVVVGAGVALASISLAYADPAVTGAWKLTVGKFDDPCTVTLTADLDSAEAGTAASQGDCSGVTVEHWKAAGNSLQLLQSNGTLVAWLHAKGHAYEGKRTSDGKLIALNR
jgi:hypothetical protein